KHLLLVLLRDGLRAEGEKARRDYASAIDLAAVFRRKQVTRHLFAYELIVWQVIVKRFDDVITVLPRVRIAVVFVIAGRIGVTRHVQPMTAPAFSVPRAGEQTFDDFFERLGRPVGEEFAHLVFGRGQPR